MKALKRIVARIGTLKVLGGLLASGLLMAPTAGSSDEVFKATSAIAIPGQVITSFDLSVVDPVLGLLLIADRSTKSIIAVRTADNNVVGFLGVGQFHGVSNGVNGINNGGPNGVITVDHHEVWGADGDSTIKVIDLNQNGATTHVINTGGASRADELCYDPQHHVVLIANDVDGFISFISTTSYSVIAQIRLNGTNGTPNATNGIEQCQWDERTGLFYINVPEVNGPANDSVPGAVLAIDPVALRIVNTFLIPVAACAGPQGMAIGPNNQIMLGCNGGPGLPSNGSKIPGTGAVAISDIDGHIIAQFPGDFGSDVIAYNEGDNHYVLTEANNTPPQLAFIDAGTGGLTSRFFDTADGLPTKDGSVVTATGLHSVAVDPVSNQVYLPVTNAAAVVAAHLCSPFGIPDTQGCVLVLTAANDDVSPTGPTEPGTPGSRFGPGR